MTLQDFKNGKLFKCAGGKAYAEPVSRPKSDGYVLLDSDGQYLAAVVALTDEGFQLVRYILGVQASGFVKFADCKLVEPAKVN